MPTITVTATDKAGHQTSASVVVTVAGSNDTTKAWFQANTGWAHTGVTLTPVTNFVSSSNGQVVDSVDITGTVTLNHTGVKFKRSRIRKSPGTAFWSKNVILEDVELGYGTAAAVGDAGDPWVLGACTLTRVYAHGFREGPRTGGMSITDCYFTDYRFVSPDHVDGMQRYAPGNVVDDHITHTFVELPAANMNGAIFYADDWRGTLYLDRCMLAGGNWSLRVHESGKLVATNNVIVKNSYSVGPTNFASAVQTGWVFTGNKLSDGTPL